MISGKRFCSGCGAKLSKPSTPRAMSDIKPQGDVLDLRAAKTAVAATLEPVKTPAPPAATITKHRASSPIVKPKPTISQAPATPTQSKQSPSTRHPLVRRFPGSAAKAAPIQPSLPNQVEGQIEAMQLLTEPHQGPSSPALQQVMATARPRRSASLVRIGSALAVIALMSGFVWLQNSPKLAFQTAAGKAGIDASLPTYIPSSYRQVGPANVSAGQLVLNFVSPSADSELSIAQRSTNWDADSLRENYVARQSDKYLAVQGEGLTIYLYNDQASWVNHGVWYTVSGTAKLSRDQVLKIAYGL